MLRGLVGSEVCIRDRASDSARLKEHKIFRRTPIMGDGRKAPGHRDIKDRDSFNVDEIMKHAHKDDLNKLLVEIWCQWSKGSLLTYCLPGRRRAAWAVASTHLTLPTTMVV